METQAGTAKSRLRAVVVSMAVHGGVFVLLLLAGTAMRRREIEPVPPQRALARIEIAGGAHAVSMALPPMETAARTMKPAPNTEATRKTILPVEPTHPKASGGGAPAAPQAGDGSGQAARGDGSDAEDAHPGFPVFSPSPPVTDRSLLPASEQKVVVDVDVDAQGQVLSETLVKGLGNGLDQICLDVVKTWRFQPATVNGKPVASEAEVIFPFNQSYPIRET